MQTTMLTSDISMIDHADEKTLAAMQRQYKELGKLFDNGKKEEEEEMKKT
jgi:hypothetical protein